MMKKNKGPRESSTLQAEITALKTEVPVSMRRKDDKDKLWCEVCKKRRHTKETCWKVQGKPSWVTQNDRGKQQGNGSRGFMVEQESPSARQGAGELFTKEQIEYLQRILGSTTKNATATHVTTTSIESMALYSLKSENWIVDSGASDHMTGLSHVFLDYKPFHGEKMVQVADGKLTNVAGIGTVKIGKLFLKEVLHVPRFTCNLISVGKVVQDNNCSVNFSFDCCVFQELGIGKKIGSGRLLEGLFVFEEEGIPRALKSSRNKDESREKKFYYGMLD